MAKRHIRRPLPAPSSVPERAPAARRPALPFTARNAGNAGPPSEPVEKPMALVSGRVLLSAPPDYRWLYEEAARRRQSWLVSAFDALGRFRDRKRDDFPF